VRVTSLREKGAVMAYSALPTLADSTSGYSGASDPVAPFMQSIESGGSYSGLSSGTSSGLFDDGSLDLLILEFLLSLTNPSSSGSGMPSMPSMPSMSSGSGVRTASYSSSASSASSGTGAEGDANVTRAGSGNPAGIAEGQLHQTAASLMQNQNVPMDKGVDTTECCANFASACLVKSGEIPASQHTNLVSTLHGELEHDGWHSESRSAAKPGDICIVGSDQHVEIVAANDNGRITLVGSNNTQGGSGPQAVSYDTYTGNQGDVTFLSE
jgi:hypothetical protein